MLTAACEGVQARGKAEVGDKTVVDALAPAAEKARETVGQPLSDALRAVFEAAEAGKEASKRHGGEIRSCQDSG